MIKKDAIRWIKDYIKNTDISMPQYEQAFEMAIKALSGEKEKGRWIQQEFIGVWTHNYSCSICGGMVCCCELDQPEYCGHCGAEMESAE